MVYMQLWNEGHVAPMGSHCSHWQRDNQVSYIMFLTTLQNNDVKYDRALNKGDFTAQYEAHDDLQNLNVLIRQYQSGILCYGGMWQEKPDMGTF